MNLPGLVKQDGSMSELRIVGLKSIPEVKGGDDVGELLVAAAQSEGVGLQDGDVVVVTQKIVSKAERRLVNVSDITPSEFAITFGKQWDKDPRKVEVVLRESKRIVRMDRGIIVTETHHGFVCANSGVDESNVAGEGVLALLPVDPDKSASEIRETIKKKTGVNVAVIISDTFGRPWRAGLTDVAIGVSGIEPITDFRGQYDKFGYELRVSIVAIADELAGAAELAGGKTANVPVVVIRGFEYTPAEGSAQTLVREPEKDMFR
jgi:coenzyme F420-0:L-glutamate ligase/coenzyme F420-1:gamma-L-glutamate ligase